MVKRKGQIPPGIARKSERLKQGLVARRELLELAISENWGVSEAQSAGIPSACSQKRICEWEDTGRGIYRMSLNTAKKYAGLFADITELLKVFLNNTTGNVEPRKARPAGSPNEIRALKEKLEAQKLRTSELASSLIELRSLTLMLLREFEDESRLTPFQRERLHEIRRALDAHIASKTGS
jgi:hypothetical protein